MSSELDDVISNYLDSYIGSFNASNYEKASSYYNEPCVSISATGTIIMSTRRDVSEFLSTMSARLRGEGFDHSEWSGPKKVIVLDEKGLVLASCGCKRLRKDGSSIEEFTATYTLRKGESSTSSKDQRWLVSAIHHHPLSTQLK
jgi:hypothetical protein